MGHHRGFGRGWLNHLARFGITSSYVIRDDPRCFRFTGEYTPIQLSWTWFTPYRDCFILSRQLMSPNKMIAKGENKMTKGENKIFAAKQKAFVAQVTGDKKSFRQAQKQIRKGEKQMDKGQDL